MVGNECRWSGWQEVSPSQSNMEKKSALQIKKTGTTLATLAWNGRVNSNIKS